MPQDYLADVTIDSEETFKSVLTELVGKATIEGVDVRGAWEFRTRGSTHDWEVEILELARDRDD